MPAMALRFDASTSLIAPPGKAFRPGGLALRSVVLLT
jgi:hypothetical protein